MSDLERTLLSEQLNWYRLLHHDFLNQWQVVMGYLQLKQNDKALTYIHDVINDLMVERQICHVAQPVVAACLVGWVIRMRLEMVEVRLEYPSEMKEASFWQEHWQEQYEEQLYAFMLDCLHGLRLKAQRYKDPMAAEITLKVRNGIFHCELLLTCRGIVLMKKTLGLSEHVRI
ncbi:MAG: Spo0B domain-containing protein [Peptococcaceae bacterium]|jgi:sensor histidine kinase regulating citrate/malate metabolism|nr:Spo0B domain-containing protein [Peptococcaceae bacterium]